jgi:DNA invertase Pin-like site-specific DNA recombinase
MRCEALLREVRRLASPTAQAAAAEHGRKAGRREVTADHAKVRRARDLKSQGLAPADIGKIIGASRATVYRYLSLSCGGDQC